MKRFINPIMFGLVILTMIGAAIFNADGAGIYALGTEGHGVYISGETIVINYDVDPDTAILMVYEAVAIRQGIGDSAYTDEPSKNPIHFIPKSGWFIDANAPDAILLALSSATFQRP